MVLVIIFLGLVLLLLWKHRKPDRFPPGPPKLPFLGSFPFLMKEPTTYHMVNRLCRDYGKICGFYSPTGVPNIILSDLELIREVYKLDSATDRPPLRLSSGWRYGDANGKNVKGILMGSGESWKEQRRFAIKTLKEFGFGRRSVETIVSREAVKLCSILRRDANIPTSLDVKLIISIASCLWIITVGDELSLDDARLKKVVASIESEIKCQGMGHIKKVLASLFPGLPRNFPSIFGPAHSGKTMIDNIKALVADYRKHHRETFDEANLRDFLDVHIAEQKRATVGSSFYGAEGVQQEEIILVDLFLAGSETTSTTITWGIFYLLHHPDVQEKIQLELDRVVGRDCLPSLRDADRLPYTGAVLQEILRCSSVVYLGVPHLAGVDLEVGGYRIPRGSSILANILQVMHNPAVFPNPELFRPERFLDPGGRLVRNTNVVPFLVGKRSCPGYSFAEQELFIFLTVLLQAFTFRAVPGEPLPSYNIRSKAIPTPDKLIRFCPPYRLIIEERP